MAIIENWNREMDRKIRELDKDPVEYHRKARERARREVELELNPFRLRRRRPRPA